MGSSLQDKRTAIKEEDKKKRWILVYYIITGDTRWDRQKPNVCPIRGREASPLLAGMASPVSGSLFSPIPLLKYCISNYYIQLCATRDALYNCIATPIFQPSAI